MSRLITAASDAPSASLMAGAILVSGCLPVLTMPHPMVMRYPSSRYVGGKDSRGQGPGYSASTDRASGCIAYQETSPDSTFSRMRSSMRRPATTALAVQPVNRSR